MTKQINIIDLLPLLKPGWVAMDENGDWFWHGQKPGLEYGEWHSWGDSCWYISGSFNITPAEDWKKSLIKCGPKPELKIEVGRCYRTREGKKAFIISKNKEKCQYWFLVVTVNSAELYRVCNNGAFLDTDNLHRNDLIEEWKE